MEGGDNYYTKKKCPCLVASVDGGKAPSVTLIYLLGYLYAAFIRPNKNTAIQITHHCMQMCNKIPMPVDTI